MASYSGLIKFLCEEIDRRHPHEPAASFAAPRTGIAAFDIRIQQTHRPDRFRDELISFVERDERSREVLRQLHDSSPQVREATTEQIESFLLRGFSGEPYDGYRERVIKEIASMVRVYWDLQGKEQLEPENQIKYKTTLGRKIDYFRNECGWSYEDLANKSGIDKRLIWGHVKQGKGADPKTLKLYADTFSKFLGRPIEVDDLKA